MSTGTSTSSESLFGIDLAQVLYIAGERGEKSESASSFSSLHDSFGDKEESSDESAFGSSVQEESADGSTVGTSFQEESTDGSIVSSSVQEEATDSSVVSLSVQEEATDSSVVSSSDQEESTDGSTTGSSDEEETAEDSDESNYSLSSDEEEADDEVSETSYQPEFDQPLYEGANITLFDTLLLLLQFLLRFHLSIVAFDSLLKLISALLPKTNKMVKSYYMLKKWCKKVFPDIVSTRRLYCVTCQAAMEVESLCPHCGCSEVGYFLSADVGNQLKERFKDPEFCKALHSRSSECESPYLRDVYDGFRYKRHKEFLCKTTNPANLSFILNTDGVAMFRSSSKDIWPIYLAINELPPRMRFSKKHLILGGLWFGKEKPNMITFLEPLIDQINNLCNNGIKVQMADGKNCVSHAVLLLCSVDLPARAILCNMNQFNGKCACCTCEDTGDNTVTATHMHRVWPYRSTNKLRTEASVHSSVKSAVMEKKVVKGYKGFPILAKHKQFDIVAGVVTDYMHCILLGVTKYFLNLWLDGSNKGKPYYIGNQISLINRRIRTIKVPDIIKRPPRELKERKHWKGTEWQYWLLFYSLPVLSGILPRVYYLHYCTLVCGVSILLGNRIERAALNRADTLLMEFYRLCDQLYGPLVSTMNVHQLRHLKVHVQNWGPLWCFSCFGFESVNGDIKKLFHGTREMSEQMIFGFTVLQRLPRLVNTSLSCRAKAIYCSLFGDNQRLGKQTYQYSPGSWRIGRCEAVVATAVSNTLESSYHLQVNSVYKFWRFQSNQTLFYCKDYSRVTSRNSYTVCFVDIDQSFQYGCILYFVEVRCTNSVVHAFAVIKLFTAQCFMNSPHLFRCQNSNIEKLIPVKSIHCKCVCINVDDSVFVGKFPCAHIAYLS